MKTKNVYSGWPLKNVDIGKIQSCDFSSNGQWLTITNHQGRAMLYKIKH